MRKRTKNIPAPGRFENVSVRFAEGPTVTVAEVGWYAMTAAGEARCNPEDDPDRAVGRTLAVGRALEQLGEALIQFGIQRSAHH